jgi:hypothetical protein
LQIALTLDTATAQITGTVSGSQGTANLTAYLASNVLPSQRYTVLLSPSAQVTAVSPPGDGYLLATNAGGMVTLIGALADGTGYSQTAPVSAAGFLPLYASLYTNSPNTSPGLLLGWIDLTNLQASPPANALTWIKKSSHAPGIYTNGFTNALFVQGSVWTNPPGLSSTLAITNGQLEISNAAVLLAFTNIVASGNIVTNLGAYPTNSMTGSINPKTGLVTLSFISGRVTNNAFGAILQDTTNAGGFFLTATNAGAFSLQP